MSWGHAPARLPLRRGWSAGQHTGTPARTPILAAAPLPAGGKAAAGRRRGCQTRLPPKIIKKKFLGGCGWSSPPRGQLGAIPSVQCVAFPPHRIACHPCAAPGDTALLTTPSDGPAPAARGGVVVRRRRRGWRQDHPPAPPERDTRGSAGCLRGGDAPLGRPRRGYPLPDATERSRGGGGHSA